MKALLLVFILFFVVWDVAWLVAGVGQTPTWRLRKMLGKAPEPQLLDVRTPAEFAFFHIPGAVNRPDALGGDVASLGLDPKRPVVVVCMTGHRSPFVAKKLATGGFPEASNLTWGMLGWLVSGGSVITGRE
jgi:rhodanese-related sulfurtransferase